MLQNEEGGKRKTEKGKKKEKKINKGEEGKGGNGEFLPWLLAIEERKLGRALAAMSSAMSRRGKKMERNAK